MGDPNPNPLIGYESFQKLKDDEKDDSAEVFGS